MRENDGWSAEANFATQEALEDELELPGGALLPGGTLHCKHWGGNFGIVRAADTKGFLEVAVKGSGETVIFRSIGDFIEDGWTLD